MVIPGRVIVLSVCWGGIAFRVVNVYGPSDKQDRWDCLHSLSPHLLGRVPLVLAGDFNCILEREGRKGTGDFKFDKSSVLLKNIVNDFKLADCFKSVCPGQTGFT